MKIIEALNFLNTYSKLREQTLPIKLAYKLNKLARKLENEQNFYQENLKKILDQYAQKDEKGEIKFDENKNILLIPESTKECETKLFELQALEIEELDVEFTLDELNGLEISPMELSPLFSLIKE